MTCQLCPPAMHSKCGIWKYRDLTRLANCLDIASQEVDYMVVSKHTADRSHVIRHFFTISINYRVPQPGERSQLWLEINYLHCLSFQVVQRDRIPPYLVDQVQKEYLYVSLPLLYPKRSDRSGVHSRENYTDKKSSRAEAV